jgi:hypothetical protein
LCIEDLSWPTPNQERPLRPLTNPLSCHSGIPEMIFEFGMGIWIEFECGSRATQTLVLQRICFATMESVSLLSWETDCRLWIISLWIEGRYCLFDPPSSGFRNFSIVWTISLFQGIVRHCSGIWILPRLGLLCNTNAIRNGYKSSNIGSRLIGWTCRMLKTRSNAHGPAQWNSALGVGCKSIPITLQQDLLWSCQKPRTSVFSRNPYLGTGIHVISPAALDPIRRALSLPSEFYQFFLEKFLESVQSIFKGKIRNHFTGLIQSIEQTNTDDFVSFGTSVKGHSFPKVSTSSCKLARWSAMIKFSLRNWIRKSTSKHRQE